MKPPPFIYSAPETVEEVLDLLERHGSEARVLAGGQSLVPLMNLRMARPEVLIDLNKCAALRTIAINAGSIIYGAMVTQMNGQCAAETLRTCPLVSQALSHAGPVAVRNRATVGGTLAHADRAAELPGVAIALDATLTVVSAAGSRVIPAEKFFLGDMTTSIEPNEMLYSVSFPAASKSAFSDFIEIGLRREGVATVGLAIYLDFDQSRHVKEARLAVIGVDSAPVRLRTVESQLLGQKLAAPLIESAKALASEAVGPADDAHVKGEYRKAVTGSLVKRALEQALIGGQGASGHA